MSSISEAQEIYNQLYHSSKHLVRAGEINIDQNLLDQKNDHRRGLSIILRPDSNTANQIKRFQDEMQKLESRQYYQPKTDLHITVLSIITAYDGFKMEKIDIEHYSNIISEALKNREKFSISLQGVTCSTGAVMIQGFDESGSLQSMRENIKQAFKNSKIKDSLDSRYILKTAHFTVVRFMQHLTDPQSYFEIIEKNRDHYFGSFEISELDFVYHDWYQSDERLQILKKVKLHSIH